MNFPSNRGKYRLTFDSRDQSPISVTSDSDEEDSHLFDQEDNPEPPPRISEPSEDPFSPGLSQVHVSDPGYTPATRLTEITGGQT